MTARDWRPLLEAGEAASAWRAIERIALATREPEVVVARARAISEEENPSVAASFAIGCAGAAVLHAYLHYATRLGSHAEAAMAHLEIATALIRDHGVDRSLYYGFAGVAWVVHHLSGRLLEPSEALTREIDTQVYRLVGRGPWDDRCDLTSGLVGFGVLGLECKASPLGRAIVEATVERLTEVAERSTAGAVWPTPPHQLPPSRRDESPVGMINLGLAHGQPGIVSFLASAATSSDKAREVLAEAVRWLSAQRLAGPGVALFPPEIFPGRVPVASRLAWCYGDIGIGIALRRASDVLGSPELEAEALGIAKHSARRDPATTEIRDAGLCHGSAGAALMFARLWHEAPDEDFAAAARYWAERTLAFQEKAEAGCGYWYWDLQLKTGVVARTDGLGLLNGAVGTALALLGLVTDLEPEWDRALLLS